MAYDEHLGERIARHLREKGVYFEEKRMFGGIAFMVDQKMCVGVVKENLMIRVDPDSQDPALDLPACRPMDFTGRPMRGFYYISPAGTDLEEDLESWIGMALAFNPLAMPAKRKDKK